MARPSDIGGREGFGAAKGPTEQNILREARLYRPPIYLRVIRFVLVAIAVLVVSLVFFSAYWLFVAGNLKAGFKSWAADQLVPGIRLHYGGVEISGYPFVFRTILTKPQLSLSNTPASSDRREWRWQSSQIIAEMRPWDLSSMKLDVSGSNHIEFKRGAVRDVYRAATRQFVISAIIGNDGLPNISSLTVGGLEVRDERDNDILSARHIHFRAERLFPPELANEKPTFDFNADVQDLFLQKAFSFPMGRKIKSFHVKLQLLGPLKRPVNRETLEAWRDEGGIIEISALEARYGSMQMVASGTMALDSELQPLAAMSVKLQGYIPALDQLRSVGVIGPGEAAIAKLVLGTLFRREVDGGEAAVRLPLNIRDRGVKAGGIKLFSIPRLDWPGKATKVK